MNRRERTVEMALGSKGRAALEARLRGSNRLKVPFFRGKFQTPSKRSREGLWKFL